MKKIIGLCMAVLVVVAALSGCGVASDESGREDNVTNNETPVQNETNVSDEASASDEISDTALNETGSEERKTLVVYFSMPETTNPDNMSREEELSTVVIDGEVLGNTQYVAMVIAENTDADIFRIEPVTPYPLEHSELEDIAQREQSEAARPEIAGEVENINQYDTIFFGFPNWYYDMPMIMYSFLDQYDLSGKTIVPFVTSGGSGFSDAISTITEMEPEADVVKNGLSISRNVVEDAEDDIIQWLTDGGFIQ